LNGFDRLQTIQANYGDGASHFCNSSIHPRYDKEQTQKLKSDLIRLQKRTIAIVNAYWGTSNSEIVSELYVSEPDKWRDPKVNGRRASQEFVDVLLSYLDRIEYIDSPTAQIEIGNNNDQRPYKVFISHSSCDETFVEKLVSLLEFLGIDSPDKLLCTSISGYRIPVSVDFAEYIYKQFNEYKLFVIIVHSPNYYKSTYCLNEMGAVWVLKTDYFSILTSDFNYSDMDGFINNAKISIKVNDKDAKERLNELKDKLVPIFKPNGFNDNRWGSKRDEFLSEVCPLCSNCPSSVEQSFTDVFNACYLKQLDAIYNLVDSEENPFNEWSYYWAISGNPSISQTQFENLNQVASLLQRISNYNGFEYLDSLLNNLLCLVRDYMLVSNQHLQTNSDVYSVEKFYKAISNNPAYKEQLQQYNEYLYLIHDMTFELARLLNHILDFVHTHYKKDFHCDKGIMIIDLAQREYVFYQELEKSKSPYPGLANFLKERKNRNYHLGNEENIDNIL
jgi:hypothetical protein